MKKVISVCLVVAMILTTTSIFAGSGNDETAELKSLKLPGFSYDISGAQMDERANYEVLFKYCKENDEQVNVIISKIEGVTDKEIRASLIHFQDCVYGIDLPNGLSINLELREGKSPLLDIVKDGRVYAFGINRMDNIKAYFKKLNKEESSDAQAIEKSPVATPNATVNGGVVIKAKSSGSIYAEAIYVPSGVTYKDIDNGGNVTTTTTKLYIRVNTQGDGIGKTLRGMKFADGKVASPYEIDSMSPHKSNTKSNFVDVITYVIGRLPYQIALPSFTYDSKTSSWGITTFDYRISGVSCKWSDMSSTASTANQKQKGMMFSLALDRKAGAYPTPTGKITLSYFASGAGTFDTVPLNF